MGSKYTPFEKYLHNLPDSQKTITLGFDQIETILAAKLPASAYEDQRWWLNEKATNHLNSRSWSNAGWQIERLDVNEQSLTLIRFR